jgi:hypothetical protein
MQPQIQERNPDYPHRQIIGTSQLHPHIIQAYPLYAGAYMPHAFWEETIGETKRLDQKQRFYSACWDTIKGTWYKKKMLTPAYATIALMHINSDPSDTQCGLPFFTTYNLTKTGKRDKEEVDKIIAFAQHPNHQFTERQKDLLIDAILEYYITADPRVKWFMENWHDAVERHYGFKVDQHLPTYDRQDPFGMGTFFKSGFKFGARD